MVADSIISGTSKPSQVRTRSSAAPPAARSASMRAIVASISGRLATCGIRRARMPLSRAAATSLSSTTVMLVITWTVVMPLRSISRKVLAAPQ